MYVYIQSPKLLQSHWLQNKTHAWGVSNAGLLHEITLLCFQEPRQCLSLPRNPRLQVNDYRETSRVLRQGLQSRGSERTIKPRAHL